MSVLKKHSVCKTGKHGVATEWAKFRTLRQEHHFHELSFQERTEPSFQHTRLKQRSLKPKAFQEAVTTQHSQDTATFANS